jgi:uncharacterized protein (DUF1697 family)
VVPRKKTTAKTSPGRPRAATTAPPEAKAKGGGRTGGIMLAFLRGVNVGGNKMVAMAELRALAGGLGFGDVETFIQSGNLIFTTALDPAAVESALERAIEKRFGFTVDVVVRTAEQWRRYAAGSPFADAATDRPHMLHLGLAKAAVRSDACQALGKYAQAGERVHAAGDCLWIDYPQGAGRSKLSPTVLDRAVGSPVTSRNWRTVQKLTALVAARLGTPATRGDS